MQDDYTRIDGLRTDLDELGKSDVKSSTKFARFATRRASIRYSNRASLNIGSVFAEAGNSVAYIIKLMSTLRGRYPLGPPSASRRNIGARVPRHYTSQWIIEAGGYWGHVHSVENESCAVIGNFRNVGLVSDWDKNASILAYNLPRINHGRGDLMLRS
jgi:hypothetical protein